jgi:hemerythrin-like domain-containing protein
MVDLDTLTEAEHSFIHHEHGELSSGIERLGRLAARVGKLRGVDLADEVLVVLRWLEDVLMPHAAWEDLVVYDRIDEIAGTAWATTLMRFEHAQIRRHIDLLAGDYRRVHAEQTAERLDELRARLYGLEALLRAHLEREDAVLLPLLDS